MDAQKILVVSDIHSNVRFLKAALNWAKDYHFDAAVFLGDGLYDLNRVANEFPIKWKIVRGNNDYEYSVPETVAFELGGHIFFMCHGHRHGLYNGYDSLIAAARNLKADAALFGHTHVPLLESEGGVLLVSPGSIGNPRSRHGSTFAVIDCLPGKPLDVHFWQIDSPKEILELNL